MRGVCVAWRETLWSVRRPRLDEVCIPPHALALTALTERRWINVSHDPNVCVMRNDTVPRDPAEYERLAPQFFGKLITKTLARRIFCLSPSRFEALGLRPHKRAERYTLYTSADVIKNVLRRCGGLWSLSARRQAAMGKRLPVHCPLQLDSAHATAVHRMRQLLRSDPALAALGSDARAAIMAQTRRVRD